MTGPQTTPTPDQSRWQAWHAKNEWLSWDLFAGVLMGALVFACALTVPDILRGGRGFLFAVMGAGLAIAAMVLVGLSLLASFLSEDYLSVLNASPRGMRAVWRPYILVGVAGLATALVAAISAGLWTGFGDLGRSVALALSVGLLTWATWGTGQLLFMTIFHGEMRLKLLGARNEAQSLLSRRKQERNRSA